MKKKPNFYSPQTMQRELKKALSALPVPSLKDREEESELFQVYRQIITRLDHLHNTTHKRKITWTR